MKLAGESAILGVMSNPRPPLRRFWCPRFLATLLIAAISGSLSPPPPAFALRNPQLEKDKQRAGLEQALKTIADSGLEEFTTLLSKEEQRNTQKHLSSILRGVLEGSRDGPSAFRGSSKPRIPIGGRAIAGVRYREVLEAEYLRGRDGFAIAEELGWPKDRRSQDRIHQQQHRGIKVLANWLQPGSVTLADVVRTLKGFRASVWHLSSEDREWLSAYHQWLTQPQKLPPRFAIDLLANPTRPAQRARFFEQIGIPMELGFQGEIAPIKNAYGLVLQIQDHNGTVRHRYLMVDRTGHRFQPPPGEVRKTARGSALDMLIRGYGPVDLETAFTPIPVQTPPTIPGKRIFFFPSRPGHRRGESVYIPSNYPRDRIGVFISGHDVQTPNLIRRVVLYDPVTRRGVTVVTIRHLKDQDRFEIVSVDPVGIYGAASNPSVKQAVSHGLTGHLRGRRELPPALGALSIREYNGQKVASLSGVIYVGVGYRHPTTVPRELIVRHRDGHVTLALGLWAPDQVPGEDPPHTVVLPANVRIHTRWRVLPAAELLDSALELVQPYEALPTGIYDDLGEMSSDSFGRSVELAEASRRVRTAIARTAGALAKSENMPPVGIGRDLAQRFEGEIAVLKEHLPASLRERVFVWTAGEAQTQELMKFPAVAMASAQLTEVVNILQQRFGGTKGIMHFYGSEEEQTLLRIALSRSLLEVQGHGPTAFPELLRLLLANLTGVSVPNVAAYVNVQELARDIELLMKA